MMRIVNDYSAVRMWQRVLSATVMLLFFWSFALAQRSEQYSVASMPDNSVVYALPKTQLYLYVTFDEISEEPGELSLYAQRYLGAKDVVLKAGKRFELKEISLGSYGIPDEEQRYSVDFRRNSTGANVTLTESGLLIGINSPGAAFDPLPKEGREPLDDRSLLELMTPRSRVSAMSLLPPNYIQATTAAAKASIAADEIYRIRESRASVVSGESEQPFADGEALRIAVDRLDASERVLTQLFVGSADIIRTKALVTELEAAEDGKYVAFRFSDQYGLLAPDDLRGEPVYIEIEVVESAPVLDERDQKRLERHLRNGIIYRVPGMIKATVTYQGKRVTSAQIPVAQLGTLEVLETSLFSTRGVQTAVDFYSSNGGIKEIREVK